MGSKARERMEMNLKVMRRQRAKRKISPFNHHYLLVTDEQGCELMIVDENNTVVGYILRLDKDGMELYKNSNNIGIKKDEQDRVKIK